MTAENVNEAARATPVAGKYDVLVCGGGTSGVPAAVAAARQGARVCLLERHGFLGGVPAANINPAWHGRNRVRSDLLTEFMDRVAELGNTPPRGKRYVVDAESMKYVSQELVLAAGVEVHLDMTIAAAVCDRDSVQGVITESVSGRSAFLAERVIDATGDGVVAFRAGAQAMVGDPEGNIQGVTLRVRFGNIDFGRYFDWVEKHPELFPSVDAEALSELRRCEEAGLDFHIAGSLVPLFERHPEIPHLPFASYFNCAKLLPGELNCNATRVDGLDPNDEQARTRGAIECRRQVFALFRLLRDHVPGWEKAKIVETAPGIGVRESRCIVGDYVLTAEDCMKGTRFPDSICRNDWIHFDLHDPGRYSCDRTPGPVTIPYRCLLPKGLEDILVVGRAASADHIANSGVRQMRTVFIIGQAAGLAAARSLDLGVTPRGLPYRELEALLDANGIGH